DQPIRREGLRPGGNGQGGVRIQDGGGARRGDPCDEGPPRERLSALRRQEQEVQHEPHQRPRGGSHADGCGGHPQVRARKAREPWRPREAGLPEEGRRKLAQAQPCLPLARSDGRRAREARLLAGQDNEVPASRAALLTFIEKTRSNKKGEHANWETKRRAAPLTLAQRQLETRGGSPGG